MGLSAVPHDPTWPTTAPTTTPAEPYVPAATAAEELDRQLRAHLTLGTAAALGWSTSQLTAAVAPLRTALGDGPQPAPGPAVPPEDHLPFVLVLDPRVEPVNALVPAMRRGARSGVSVIDDVELVGYRTLDGEDVPATGPYLLTDVDTGSEFCGQTPEHALTVIRDRGRVPLTVAEGVALVTVRPDMLRSNRCFSLMASRAGNQRVPAVWISERRAKLGWCWDRNPHTWLGAASAGGRTAG